MRGRMSVRLKVHVVLCVIGGSEIPNRMTNSTVLDQRQHYNGVTSSVQQFKANDGDTCDNYFPCSV